MITTYNQCFLNQFMKGTAEGKIVCNLKEHWTGENLEKNPMRNFYKDEIYSSSSEHALYYSSHLIFNGGNL